MIQYGHLDEYLTSLGYRSTSAPTHVVYRKKGRKLPIILPISSKSDEVSLSHLAAVEQILILDGVVAPGQFTILTEEPLITEIEGPSSERIVKEQGVRRQQPSVRRVGDRWTDGS